MASNDELTFIEISDFTPGVTSSYLSSSGTTPAPGPGERPAAHAQVRDTYGCYGHPNGGLHPLPAIVERIGEQRNAVTAGYNRLFGGDFIAATHVMSPVHGTSRRDSNTLPVPATPDLISVIFQTQERRPSDGDERLRYRIIQYRRGSTPATRFIVAQWVDDFSETLLYAAHCTQVTTGTIYNEATNTYEGYETDDGDKVPGHQPGRVGIIYNVNSDQDQSEGRCFIWPRIHLRLAADATSADGMYVDTTYRLAPIISTLLQHPGAFPGYIALSHQNRYVWCKQAYTSNALYAPFLPWARAGVRLGSDSQFGSGDFWRYTPPNDLAGEGKGPSTPDGTATFPAFEMTAARFGQATSGFGAAASMNASELFLVKHTGGGTIVRGNLDAPQVTDYPGIPSSRGASCIPAVAPMGLVYGTSDGVYAWSGADQVTHISPQFDGWFWKPEDGSTDRNEFNASHGKFLYLHPFIFAPNNWVMDSRTGGWFRLVSPDEAVFKDYNASALGHFYAHPGMLREDGGIVAARFDMETGQHTYSWRSQPLPGTRNRTHRFREVNIVAQGHGTIQVTLHGLNGQVGRVLFEVDSDYPMAQTQVVSVDTHDVEVQVEGAGVEFDVNSPAPILYRMSIGHQIGNTVGMIQPPPPVELTATVPLAPFGQGSPLTLTLEDLFPEVIAAGTISEVRWVELEIEAVTDSAPVSFLTITANPVTGSIPTGTWTLDTVPGRNTSTLTAEVQEIGRVAGLVASTPPFNVAAGPQTIRFTPSTPGSYASDGIPPEPTLVLTVTGGGTYRVVSGRALLELGA